MSWLTTIVGVARDGGPGGWDVLKPDGGTGREDEGNSNLLLDEGAKVDEEGP